MSAPSTRPPSTRPPSTRPPSFDIPGLSMDPRVRHLYGKLNELSTIDGLAVPRVAIVGDRSSGKTSLSEALTGLTLPAGNRPPTLFAVHVDFRHTSDVVSSVSASIVPGRSDSNYDTARKHLESFRVYYEWQFFSDEAFADLLEDAARHMELYDSRVEDDDFVEERFSDNVLLIEITGPNFHTFSVVDLPALMHCTPNEQDTQEIDAVRALVMDYMNDQRTVILAVADATNNISNQQVFELVKMIDPQGVRTLGVLTKCDAIQHGDEKRVMRIAENKVEHLPHGWFIVKNRSPQEIEAGASLTERYANERTFFAATPWNRLDYHRVGIESLRHSIWNLVNDIMHDDLTGLLEKIQNLAHETITASHTELSFTNEKLIPHERRWKSVSSTAISALPYTGDLGKEPEIEKKNVDIERGPVQKRPTILINACVVALTIGFCLMLVGLAIRKIAQEIATDGNYLRMLLLITIPLQIFVSLFFCQSLVNSLFQLFGPVSQMKYNSKYYSAVAVPRINIANGPLPHVTIQMPVYKEGLEGVIMPTIESLNAAIADYRSHGGTCNIFVNDDGMQLISEEDRKARQQYYIQNDIGWVARPKHNPDGEGLAKFVRKGKFKKASNMNYALRLSLKVEEKLLLLERENGIWTQDEEDEAYEDALQEVLAEEQGRAWAGGNIRVGDYILIIDSDTRVPVNCMIDAVSELEESPRVAILQFSSGVMNVTTSFFEQGITFFTTLIYTAIRFSVAAGDVSPFVGHNSFLRWSALQETSFQDPGDDTGEGPSEKFWSESHVSEDFDIALRLQSQGYHVRLAAYCGDEFKEGVSLTVYDELARWEKYAYGCSELLFHPVKYWLWRGPFTPLFKRFMASNMPLGSKCTIMAYVGTYYAIGYSWLACLLNYFLLGWLNGQLDHYYMSSWNVWVALIVVFSGVGNLALAIVRYRGEGCSFTRQLWVCFRWVPLLFVFLGGISMHVGQAILCHMFSIEMTWGATAKELDDTSFFIELPIIIRKFKFTFVFCMLVTAMILCGAFVVPDLWKINEVIAIFPLATVVFSHLFLPVLLNPALMKFTW